MRRSVIAARPLRRKGSTDQEDDHRLVDGKEAVTFLVRVKEAIEDPARLLIDL